MSEHEVYGDLTPEDFLRTALANVDPEAWHNDVAFHYSMEVLAQMLVPMVQGLADACRENREMHRRSQQAAEEEILAFHISEHDPMFNFVRDYMKKKD